MHGTLGRSTSPPFPSLPLTPQQPHTSPRHASCLPAAGLLGASAPGRPAPGRAAYSRGTLEWSP